MGSRTRYFLIGSALVVVVGLGAGVVAYYGGTWARSGAGRAELAYVPAGARAVGYANVRDIMDSQFRQRLLEAMPGGEGRNQLMAETGIDIEKDIDSVVLGLMGNGGDGGAVIIMRGRFDQARIEKLATEHGATTEQYKSVRLLRTPGEAGGITGLAFLEPAVLAIGTTSGLKGVVDASTDRASVVNDAALMRVVSEIETSGNAWFVGRTSALTTNGELPDQVRRHLEGLEWVAASANVSDIVRARVRAEARDEKAAEDLRTVINGAIAAVRLLAGQDARVADAIKSIETTGRGRTVELSFSAPVSMIDMMRAGPTAAPPAAPPAK